MDGKVVIGMDLDTKELEKKLKESQKQLESYEKEQEQLLEKRKNFNIDTTEAQEKLKKLYDTIEFLTKKRDEYAQKHGTSGFSYQMQTEEINNYKQQAISVLSEVNNKYEEIDRAIEQNAINQQLVTKEIEETQKKLSDAKGYKDLNKNLKSIGKIIDKNVKMVAKWALGFVGLRAGINMLRSAYSTIAQYDKQMATDMEYLRYVLAMSLKPVIEWIIKAFYQLLALFGYFVKQITGKNIFANAGADKFKKDLDGANKSAKELKKQLAGFDEANVLSDNKTSGGANVPTQDIAKMVDAITDADVEKMWDDANKGIKDARKSLLDYQDELNDIMNRTDAFDKAYDVWSNFVQGIGRIWQGLVDIVAGVWDMITAYFNIFMDIISGDNKKLVEDVKLLLTGLFEWYKGTLELAVGVIQLVLGAIQGVLSTICNWIKEHILNPIGDAFANAFNGIKDEAVQNWENIKQSVIDFWDSAKEVPKKMKNTFVDAVNFIKNAFAGLWSSIISGAKGLINKAINFGNSIKSGIKSVINWFIDGFNKLIDGLNKLHIDKPEWMGGGSWGINIPRIPRLATGGIVNMPSRGVMVGNAVAGERGREGVIPLTDPNAMAQLGREIGQWVNLAIDNRMVVDGRVLATATNNQINKESFLMNR